jgi:1-acyl-sn-glycerol-3-phosphate acyltransferase
VPDGANLPKVRDDPLKARSRAAVRAFSLYLRWYTSRNFEAVRIAHAGMPIVPAEQPLIICTNHPGWWDPVILILLQDILFPGRLGFGPMDRAALGKYGVLRRVGIFGIDSNSRHGAAEFLQQGVRILADPRAVLWVTAEGGFTDPRVRPVRLRRGIAHLARRVPEAIVLPLALEYPFWNERFPQALGYFGAPIAADPQRSASDWTTMLEAAMTQTLDALATESLSRDPTRFRRILHGRAGVGGLYDLWRHTRAFAHGRHFNPRHEARE